MHPLIKRKEEKIICENGMFLEIVEAVLKLETNKKLFKICLFC